MSAALALPAAASANEDTPPQIAFEESGAGRTLTTTDARPLYWSRSEAATQSITCIDECLAARQPLLAEPMTEPPPGWTVVMRPDNTPQWAYEGKPLYTFAGDTYSGARLGAGGQWVLAFQPFGLPVEFSLQTTLVGRVLADHKGRTLYAWTDDKPPVMSRDWQPFTAPWLAVAGRDWAFGELASGDRQWVYKGKPLYRYLRDRDPQDAWGHGLDGGWSAVILEPPPGAPAWVTIQRVDIGWVFADAEGMTLYASADYGQMIIAQTCPEACMKAYWRPVIAAPGAQSVGRWKVVDTEAGLRQWTFDGRLLFLHTRDTKPGEMTGNSYAVGYSIGDGFRVLPIELNLPPPI